MGKPRMIILIRHAQSEGNKNREIHQTIPDHRVKLTPEGHRQALEAGTRLRGLLRPDDTIHFFTSPYRRTRETTEGILKSLTADTPSPSPFPRHTIKVYEEPRLREQDFGNFQPCSAEMERMWLERADYGHFFYRIPNGESAADAYDRVSGFNESLWRLFGEQDFARVCVLVTHGLMTRIFLMKWYHWSVEYFEDLRNINHCEFVIMKLNEDNGKYALQNQLRSWSELKREKELERQRERTAKGLGPLNPTPSETHVPIRRKWGGCPDGCNHGLHRKSSRSSRAHGGDQPRNDRVSQHKQAQISQEATQNNPSLSAISSMEGSAMSEVQTVRAPEPALGDRSDDERPLETLPSDPEYPKPNRFDPSPEQAPQPDNPNHQQTTFHYPPSLDEPANPAPKRPSLAHFHRDSEDHLLHPPRSNYGLIHLVGRDGGGTLSGANSPGLSEDDQEYGHHHRHRHHHHEHKHKSAENTHAGTKRRNPRQSQDLDNDGDGDDEGSGRQTPKLRRTRSHNHNESPQRHHHLAPAPRQEILGTTQNVTNQDMIDAEPTRPVRDSEDRVGYECRNQDKDGRGDEMGEDTLEQARKEDQSIGGSVY
ncbi:acid phosphatase DET1 [Aspergillus lucknowensis]|uniref:Histidine phosphatase superfamily n=1 Tax=Aspergillus lucknowensis TaxID=176173 RepID=A0ABR4LV23_9EURO